MDIPAQGAIIHFVVQFEDHDRKGCRRLRVMNSIVMEASVGGGNSKSDAPRGICPGEIGWQRDASRMC